MIPWILPAIGSVGGALANNKNPLMGAAIGGGLGLAGGAALPSLGAGAGTQAGMLAAQEAGMGLGGTLGWKGATTGLQGMANAATQGGLLDTAGNAMRTAQTVKSMMPPEQPMPAAPGYSSGGGAPMTGVYGQIQQGRQAQMQADLQRRMRRNRLIG